jgi:hypothetical protein
MTWAIKYKKRGPRYVVVSYLRNVSGEPLWSHDSHYRARFVTKKHAMQRLDVLRAEWPGFFGKDVTIKVVRFRAKPVEPQGIVIHALYTNTTPVQIGTRDENDGFELEPGCTQYFPITGAVDLIPAPCEDHRAVPVHPLRDVLFAMTRTTPPVFTAHAYSCQDLTEVEKDDLQTWAVMHVQPRWATGIGLIEAAEAQVAEAVSNGNIPPKK